MFSGHSYFFKDSHYLKMDDSTLKIVKVGEVKKDWLRCWTSAEHSAPGTLWWPSSLDKQGQC